MCGCEACIESYQRCPFWKGDDTCDLFLWDEDFDKVEDVNGVGNIDGNRLNDLEVA